MYIDSSIKYFSSVKGHHVVVGHKYIISLLFPDYVIV